MHLCVVECAQHIKSPLIWHKGLFINTCCVLVNSRQIVPSVKEEGKARREGRKERRWWWWGHLHSCPSVKEKSRCGGMNSVHLFRQPRLFSAQRLYGYWKGVAITLLPRRSQYFSLSFLSPSLLAVFFFCLIQYFLQNAALSSAPGAGNAAGQRAKRVMLQCRRRSWKKKMQTNEAFCSKWLISYSSLSPSRSRLLRSPGDQLRPFYGADVCKWLLMMTCYGS